MKKNIWWVGPSDKPGEMEKITASLEKCFPDHEVTPRHYTQAEIVSHIASAVIDENCDVIALPEDRLITVDDLRFAKESNVRLIRMRRNIVSTMFVIDKKSGDVNLQYGKDRIEWQYVDSVVERTHGSYRITVEINGAMIKHKRRAK